MADPKVVHGGRVQVFVGTQLIGTFNSCTYSLAYDTQDAYILGRMSPAEIGYTAQEPISGSLNGWRVVKNGPHVVGLPALQELLTRDYTTLMVFDRVTGERISRIQGVRLLGFSSGHARGFSEYGIPFKGMLMSDESQENVEAKGASDLP